MAYAKKKDMTPIDIHSLQLTPGIDFQKSKQWKLWFFFLFLAFLLHLLIFLIHIRWEPTDQVPPPVEIQQLHPNQLDRIRKQWKEKDLYLDQEKNKKSDQAQPDARYQSDRNIQVEKEQRAKETTVLPRPGSPQGDTAHRAPPHSRSPEIRARSSRAHPSQPLPKLGSLGVPLDLKASPETSSDAHSTDLRTDARANPKMNQNPSPRSETASNPQGGNQYIHDKQLPIGGETLLNAQESVFYSFYARLYEAIGPIWQSRLHETTMQNRILSGDYTTTVDVVLDENGNLQGIRRLQSSGIPEFDEAVDEAWKKIQRFPNPPKGLLDAERQVHTGWSFTVHVGDGFPLTVLPPERRY